MNRPQTALRPRVESLESLTLLSGLAASMHAVAALATAPNPTTPRDLALNGTVHGTYTSHSLPDVGTTYDLTGHGHVSHLGRTSLTGNLHSVGFIVMLPVSATTPDAHATGQVFLSDSRGTVTLTLTGPPQEAFANLPDRFTYKVTNGSGAFRNVSDTGTIVLVRDPSHGKASPTVVDHDHGHFTLVIISDLDGGGKTA